MSTVPSAPPSVAIEVASHAAQIADLLSGGNTVVCQPGTSDMAKSNDTTECTESTSGVENAARNRYARTK